MLLSIFLNHSLKRTVMEIIVHHYKPVMPILSAATFSVLRRKLCVCVYNENEPY
jgi:hypothetical protein